MIFWKKKRNDEKDTMKGRERQRERERVYQIK